MPALYKLAIEKRLPSPFYLIGFARRDWDDEYLKEYFRNVINNMPEHIPFDVEVFDQLKQNIHYVRSSFYEDDGYRKLNQLLSDLKIKNRLYYLAAPPEAYVDIIQKLGKVKLANSSRGYTNIVVEKPYGEDSKSAKVLDAEVHKVFDESQVYRINHYLGKETVQNILVFRKGKQPKGARRPWWKAW